MLLLHLALSFAYAQDDTTPDQPTTTEPAAGAPKSVTMTETELVALLDQRIQRALSAERVNDLTEDRVRSLIEQELNAQNVERIEKRLAQYRREFNAATGIDNFFRIGVNIVREVDRSPDFSLDQKKELFTEIALDLKRQYDAYLEGLRSPGDHWSVAKTYLCTLVKIEEEAETERAALISAATSMAIAEPGKGVNVIFDTVAVVGGAMLTIGTIYAVVDPDTDSEAIFSVMQGFGTIGVSSDLLWRVFKTPKTLQKMATAMYVNSAFTDAVSILQVHAITSKEGNRRCLDKVEAILGGPDRRAMPSGYEIVQAQAQFNQCYAAYEERMIKYEEALQIMKADRDAIQRLNSDVGGSGIVDLVSVDQKIGEFESKILDVQGKYLETRAGLNSVASSVQDAFNSDQEKKEHTARLKSDLDFVNNRIP